ncbi:MAG: type IV pilus twitching motility protein PilT [Dehalococcoidia bacterium]|nr:type IV pilus twitching motility protein PilT [Dehalococcoidia bacterium]
MHINDLLRLAVEMGASDLHLGAPNPPVLRINGELVPLNDQPGDMSVLTPLDVDRVLYDVTSVEQRKIFAQELELDFAYSVPGLGRFRANACVQRATTSLSFRLLHTINLDIDELGLPGVCKELALKERGLVLVTGPAGSGKSTTLAAMIAYLNNMKCRRIITIEDPVEFLYENNKCFISQREVGTDTWSFAVALKHALRQDPNVILVGEMRDLETVTTVLTAAETGHLILTTLHTPSAPQAIDRIVDVFPPHQQQQARIQLSTCVEGVLYQTLIPRLDGAGRVVAVEVLMATDATRNLIREAKTPQMWSVMQTGSHHGMQTMDQSLLNLYNRGIISLENALIRCRDQETVKKSLVRTTGRW